ncbi:hypothetical protein [Aquibacillus rhizosphaerae]|uniref:ABC transporter periplasmic binding protein yphF n=1 Tax=Aquibacillus rhizosphaerae TaxID=3051431 RepID=A0ABT7L4K6_9BACI|nr:hypothetical protein [Aquibacillus sp. LR5S19]MDL4840795.1 hypothetical protein [Aquibacillus sp. LR5S19]
MRLLKLIPLIFFLVVLSGCFYPNDNLSKNKVPNDIQLNMVQDAVNQYVEINQGLVPIKTKSNDTPIFQKYLIDFSSLKQQNVLSEIPGTAFENGGVYQYVLVTPEEDPQVKVIDLRNAEVLRNVQHRLTTYRNEHIYPPFDEEIQDGVFTINYELLGLEAPPYVQSPYTQQNLPIIMDVDGNLYIDYSPDLYEALNTFEHDYKEGEDIRFILVDNYPFVPAYSLPYTIKSGEPVFNLD